MSMLRQRWLKPGLALLVPLILAVLVAKRASWRPRVLHYKDDVVAVAYSPDGRWLACLTPGQLEMRDAHSEEVVWRESLGSDKGDTLAVAPDSHTLALGCVHSLQFWDIPTHTRQHNLAYYPAWLAPDRLLFTRDSALLVTGDDSSYVRLWDTQATMLPHAIGPRRPADNSKIIIPAALSTDGRTLALVVKDLEDSCAQLWNLTTGQQYLVLRPSQAEVVNCVALAPDQKTLAMGTEQGAVLFWDLTTGQRTREFHAHSGVVTNLVFSADGQRLVTCSGQELKLWDAHQGQLLRTLTEHANGIIALSFAADSATLAVACGQTVQLWRIK